MAAELGDNKKARHGRHVICRCNALQWVAFGAGFTFGVTEKARCCQWRIGQRRGNRIDPDVRCKFSRHGPHHAFYSPFGAAMERGKPMPVWTATVLKTPPPMVPPRRVSGRCFEQFQVGLNGLQKTQGIHLKVFQTLARLDSPHGL